MYLATSDPVNGVDMDDSSQTQQANTPSVASNASPPSSPCCSTLLVIDDNSNSNDSTVITNDTPTNLPSPNVQTSHVQRTSSPSLPIVDITDGTPEQQRRRNSSIAKLLGGQPLNNQQYKEINQQILDDQSAQNVPNTSDNKTDGETQRSRSSIARTILMNAEQNNSTMISVDKPRPPSPGYSKDFEYLIRRELDVEHPPLTLKRDSSKPSVFQNLNGIRNSPVEPQSPTNSKLKRKRTQPKQTGPLPTTNKSSNMPPFSILDPFELDSSSPSIGPPINHVPPPRAHQHQNELFHFDRLSRHYRHQSQPPVLTQHQQQYSLPMNNSTSFNYPKTNIPPMYAQFKTHSDHASTASSPYSYARFPQTPELKLPAPVSPLSAHAASPSAISQYFTRAPSRKTKTAINRSDISDIPMQRSFSNTSHQFNTSLSSSSSSSPSEYCAPLKKRLLQSYKNEHQSSSS
ncbi:unnamed protein product [Adineta ricciae]|uniref:Uncharacterized protein n=1 Tax=Adineta ricciae TaxID=249248 RepID=A0A814YGI0_ADIRI|nr:unnamed protein product [Adineta ricciae]CAF1230040.1 unnamed protein product [Adineta ricciae]